jgi:hypothetical protein
MSQAAVPEKAIKAPPTKKMPVKSALTPPKFPAKKAVAAKPEKTQASPKAKKEKLVRDSFTIPESEYVVLSSVKKACLEASIEVKKSELLRVAIGQLSQMSIPKLSNALNNLQKIQTGRPKK